MITTDMICPVASVISSVGIEYYARIILTIPWIVLAYGMVLLICQPKNESRLSIIRKIGLVPIWVRLIIFPLICILGVFIVQFKPLCPISHYVLIKDDFPEQSLMKVIEKESGMRLQWVSSHKTKVYFKNILNNERKLYELLVSHGIDVDR